MYLKQVLDYTGNTFETKMCDTCYGRFGRGVYGVIYPKLVVIELLPQLKISNSLIAGSQRRHLDILKISIAVFYKE